MGDIMGAYIVDFILVAGLVIGITAINGVLVNGFGEKFIGRKHKSEFVDQSARIQTGWKQVGGGHKGN
jgi:hypothetical protein